MSPGLLLLHLLEMPLLCSKIDAAKPWKRRFACRRISLGSLCLRCQSLTDWRTEQLPKNLVLHQGLSGCTAYIEVLSSWWSFCSRWRQSRTALDLWSIFELCLVRAISGRNPQFQDSHQTYHHQFALVSPCARNQSTVSLSPRKLTALLTTRCVIPRVYHLHSPVLSLWLRTQILQTKVCTYASEHQAIPIVKTLCSLEIGLDLQNPSKLCSLTSHLSHRMSWKELTVCSPCQGRPKSFFGGLARQ